MSRRFTYSAILVVALPLIAAAGILYARGTGGYESATGHKSISHEAPPRTIDPRIVRQMPPADASSQIYELWQREGLQGFTGMRFDNDKGEVILYWKGQVPHRMVALCARRNAAIQLAHHDAGAFSHRVHSGPAWPTTHRPRRQGPSWGSAAPPSTCGRSSPAAACCWCPPPRPRRDRRSRPSWGRRCSTWWTR